MATHSIRIPIHGFVEFSDWERDIINHPVFQRLRRIRQLAFSEHVYPGSTHSRFEHSLGVMHIASKLFDHIEERCGALVREITGTKSDRAKSLVRLAALLHDIGHGPLSHLVEELMPRQGEGKRFDHEDYTAALLAEEMRDVIDDHAINKRELHLTGQEIADFYRASAGTDPHLFFWRELVSGQLDADRMDYLLRDGHHCGVSYGSFDLGRLIDTITVVQDDRSDSATGLRLAIEEGGLHAAEALILSRYFMFTQVYFHPVRKAFDRHAAECVTSLLHPSGFPDPGSAKERRRFLKLDDWTVMDFIRRGRAGRHGEAILTHAHDRCVYRTPEIAGPKHLLEHHDTLMVLRRAKIPAWSDSAEKSWYKVDSSDVQIAFAERSPERKRKLRPLSQVSAIVAKISPSNQKLIFVPQQERERADAIILKKMGG